MDNICSGFNKYPIYKVIFKISRDLSEDYKYIFVGPQEDDIFKILYKLSSHDDTYQSLKKEEQKKLKSTFGPYETIFGEIIPKKTKFSNLHISDFDNIEHIKEDVSYLISEDIINSNENLDVYQPYLKNVNFNYNKIKKGDKSEFSADIYKDLLPQDIYLWTNPEYMNNDYFLNILNFIFENKNKLLIKDLVQKINSITMTKNISELHDKIMELLPKKYQNKSQIGTFKSVYITFERAYLNEDIRYLIFNSSVKLGCSHKIVINNEDFFYYNYSDPIKAIFDKVPFKESIIYENKNYNLISKNCKIKHHTIFMTTRKILKKYNLSNTLEKYYFEIQKKKLNIEEEIEHIKKSYINRNYKQLLIIKDSKISKSNCKIKNFIFKYNEINTRDYKNLNYIFKKFKTNSFIPIITYVKNYKNNEILYKLNKSFTLKTDGKELSKYYNIIPNANVDLNSECLIFNCRLEENIFINCYLYTNSYFIISSSFDKYKSIKNLENIIKIINLLVKSLNKIVSFKLIGNVETSVIFRNKYTNIPTQRFINCNLSIDYQIKDYKGNLYSELKKIFYVKSKTYSFISNPIKPELKLVYKGVENFFSPDNFIITIIKSLKKNGGKLSKKSKSDLNDQLSFLFLTSSEYNNTIIDKIVNDKDYYDLDEYETSMNGILLTLYVKDNKTKITIENIDHFSYVKKILFDFENILANINNNQTFITNSELNKEDKLKTKKASKQKLENYEYDLSDFQEDMDIIDSDLLSDDLLQDDLLQMIEDEEAKENTKKQSLSSIKDTTNKNDNSTKKDELDLQNDKFQEKFELNIKKKGDNKKKLNFSNYISNMRMSKDPELYSKDQNYNRICPNTDMRQPYIVSKKQLESFDPKAVPGYMKYRDNYYICPRIWDAKAEKPISVETFINNKLRSPYNEGKAIPIERRNKQVINDEYSVIIRKPTSKDIWTQKEKEKNWPNLLKKTGRDAFPGFTKEIIDKSKNEVFCRPCCYKNIPGDYIPNDKEIPRVNKVNNFQKCLVASEKDKKQTKLIEREIKKNVEDSSCILENYILNESSILKNCRLGLLPEELDLLLNNNQNLFLTRDRKHLINYANVFLRKGIYHSKEDSNFLEVIGSLKNIFNINILKDIILKSITFDTFISLNDGDLITIFSSNHILPAQSNEIKNFRFFLEDNPKLYLSFGINLDNINNFEKLLDDKVKNFKIIKKFIIIYKMFSAYERFIEYTKSNLKKDYYLYKYYLDFVSRPNKLLFENGINIIIFDKKDNNLLCNPYINSEINDFIILIKDNDNNFQPVVQTLMIFDKIKINDIISINNINLNKDKLNKMGIKIKEKDLTKIIDRKNYLKKIFFFHENICNKNSEFVDKENHIKHISKKINAKAYVVTNNNKIQYIHLDNNLLLPILPFPIFYNLPIKLLSDINLLNVSTINYIDMYCKLDNTLIKDFKYKISYLLKNHKNEICGIQFENNLMVPIKPDIVSGEELIKLHKKYPNIIVKDQEIYTDFTNFDIKEKIQIHQLIYQDLMYQQFKYEFSNLINEKQQFKYYKSLKNMLEIADINDNHKIFNIVYQVMKQNSKNDNYDDKISILPGMDINICYKNKRKKCVKNKLCTYDKKDNICKLNLDDKILNLFSYLLTYDLLNSENDRYTILSNMYFPKIYIENLIFENNNEFYSHYSSLIRDISNVKNEKFHKDIPIQKYFKLKYETHFLTKKELSEVEDNLLAELEHNINNISQKIIEDSLEYIIPKKTVIATPFDNNGNLNTKMGSGPCIFPYLSESSYNLKYNCSSNNKGLLTCPISVDESNKPLKWGYCPEDPEVTRKRLDIIDVDAIGSKENKFYAGKCKFPYLEDKYKLSFQCKKEKENTNEEYSWCPVKFRLGQENTPIAATNKEDIWDNKWRWKDVFFKDNKKSNEQNNIDNKEVDVKYNGKEDVKDNVKGAKKAKKGDIINNNFLKTLKKGYCQPPKNFNIPNNDPNKILLETYNPKLCTTTPSKGGIGSKFDLFNFGVNKLQIPYTLLMKNNIVLSKEELCKIINKYYYKLNIEEKKKTKRSKEDLIKIYGKNINKCNEGESKGGYKLKELKAIAIKYFNLSKYDSLNMSKKDVCSYIYNIIKDIEISDEKIVLPQSLDINLCYKVPNRGGYTLRYLKDLAKYFNLESNINKIELCKKINKKLLKNVSSAKKSIKKKINIKSEKKTVKKIRKNNINNINNLNNLNNINS